MRAAAIPAADKIEFGEQSCNFELLRTIVKIDEIKLAEELSSNSLKRFFIPAEFNSCCKLKEFS